MIYFLNDVLQLFLRSVIVPQINKTQCVLKNQIAALRQIFVETFVRRLSSQLDNWGVKVAVCNEQLQSLFVNLLVFAAFCDVRGTVLHTIKNALIHGAVETRFTLSLRPPLSSLRSYCAVNVDSGSTSYVCAVS